jgi:hypothetical protein
MAEKPKRTRWGLWVVAFLLVAYPLSVTPVHWLIGRESLPYSATHIYKPLDWLASMAPQPLAQWWKHHRFMAIMDAIPMPPDEPLGYPMHRRWQELERRRPKSANAN